jgi:hypothetical protein
MYRHQVITKIGTIDASYHSSPQFMHDHHIKTLTYFILGRCTCAMVQEEHSCIHVIVAGRFYQRGVSVLFS